MIFDKFAVYDLNGKVFLGLGETREEAMQEAKFFIDELCDSDLDQYQIQVMRITSNLFDEVELDQSYNEFKIEQIMIDNKMEDCAFCVDEDR